MPTKLQERRKAAGLTQIQLADAAGLTVGVLRRYEQGARNLDGAKVETLARLAIACKCTIPDILEEERVGALINEAMKKPRR